YRYVIELGRSLAPLPDEARNDANKVQGCASQVWLDTRIEPNGTAGPVLTFRGDSDAHIVRGLIAILLTLYSGKPARDILETDAIAALERLALRSCRRAGRQLPVPPARQGPPRPRPRPAAGGDAPAGSTRVSRSPPRCCG